MVMSVKLQLTANVPHDLNVRSLNQSAQNRIFKITENRDFTKVRQYWEFTVCNMRVTGNCLKIIIKKIIIRESSL